MWALILATVLSLSFGAHDHSQHIDAKFIAGEARRIAYLPLDAVVKYIEEYTEAIKFIERKFEDHFSDPSPDEKPRLQKIWQENFEPNYRDTYDRLLIISHVCQDVHNDPACELPDDMWNDKYDNRGEKFRAEFMEEVHKSVANDV
jgi:hypothetical protein